MLSISSEYKVFNSNFSQKNVINFLSSTKGLEYFLEGSFLRQSQIDKFKS